MLLVQLSLLNCCYFNDCFRVFSAGFLGMAILGGGIAVIGGLAIAAFAASKR